MKNMEFIIEGKITIDVTVRVHADDEKSAIELAKNVLIDSYNLNVYGNYHNPDTDIKLDLESFDID